MVMACYERAITMRQQATSGEAVASRASMSGSGSI
jgi:hypothetical protein